MEIGEEVMGRTTMVGPALGSLGVATPHAVFGPTA